MVHFIKRPVKPQTKEPEKSLRKEPKCNETMSCKYIHDKVTPEMIWNDMFY